MEVGLAVCLGLEGDAVDFAVGGVSMDFSFYVIDESRKTTDL